MLLAAFIISSPVFSASKKKKKTKETETSASAETNTTVSVDDTSYKLPTGKNQREYFSKVDPEVLLKVQNGSPDSLREAMSLMRQKSGEYEEYENVLAVVSSEIMKLVWPSEKITWDIPVVTAETPYTGAISSVKQGVFDSSTGNVDFLTTLLPALVIVNSNSDISIIESCETALKSALQIQPDSVLANYLLAMVYERKRGFENAEKYMAAAYEVSPKTSEISLAYSRILRANGKLAEASKILNSIDNTINDIAVLKQNAYISFDAGDYDSAELYVARVLQQTPNDLEFLLFRAKILVEKKDYIHAVSLLDVYARQDSSSIDYLVLRARVQLDWSKNTAAASETVEKALQMYPDNTDALMFAARISSETDSPVAGKYADELAARVLEKKPGNVEAMTYALDGLIQRENWQEAYAASKNLIAMGNVSSAVVEKYVNVCIKMNKYNEAYEYAKLKYDANPSDEVLLQSYILAYSMVGNRDSVLKYIDSLMNTSSSKVKSYLYYRRSYLQLTEEKSLADLRSSLIANPRNSDALFRLYELYYAKQDYRKAQYYLRQVVAINPNDSSFKKLNEALTKLIQ
ncbi:Tetratricopeptide repeat-containing protein [Treponema bryantii]|uniref:Tetratricopeptide repeat-containing protein n=2 Tax=Treponema bryantii TaxID=163 RepID=A0A1I3KWH0_9SPIR|nr:Tetratricopeptide repeat-containing protein [Treponema bryantii]